MLESWMFVIRGGFDEGSLAIYLLHELQMPATAKYKEHKSRLNCGLPASRNDSFDEVDFIPNIMISEYSSNFNP